MIAWRDEGIVLRATPHGETAAIAEIFTATHGRHAGVVRGGAGRRMRPILQPGCVVSVDWRARLDAHVGAFTPEPLRSSAGLMSDPTALAALSAVTGLLAFGLPERDPHAELYARSVTLIGRLAGDAWPADYLRWERRLLDDLGYGLELGACAVTGAVSDLAYVSPKTGRAVSRTAAAAWADRLLPLPAALVDEAPAPLAEVVQGLATTGHFLARLAADLGDRPLPPSRARLVTALERRAADA